jgi:hypothetical protein
VVGLDGKNWLPAPTTVTYTYSVRAWSGATKKSGVEYVLYPTYSFEASDGKTYSGHLNTIGGSPKTYRNIGSEDKLRDLLVKDTKIYYNPSNPEQSAVEQPFLNPVLIFLLVIGSLLSFSVGIYLIIDEVRSRKSGKQKKPYPTFNLDRI